MMGIDASNPHRGILQPAILEAAKPAEGSVKCERCGCRWIPDEECFGCPGCETRDDLYEFLVEKINDPDY